MRQIAREAGHSVVEVGPVLRDLIEHGAVCIGAGRPARAARTRPDPAARRGPRRPRGRREDGGEPIEMVTSVPDPSAQLGGDALDRERAALAAKAGLSDAGPVPTQETEDSDDPASHRTPPPPTDAGSSEITSDRGALLRLFSGLRDQD